jgi:hypothetical protein
MLLGKGKRSSLFYHVSDQWKSKFCKIVKVPLDATQQRRRSGWEAHQLTSSQNYRVGVSSLLIGDPSTWQQKEGGCIIIFYNFYKQMEIKNWLKILKKKLKCQTNLEVFLQR